MATQSHSSATFGSTTEAHETWPARSHQGRSVRGRPVFRRRDQLLRVLPLTATNAANTATAPSTHAKPVCRLPFGCGCKNDGPEREGGTEFDSSPSEPPTRLVSHRPVLSPVPSVFGRSVGRGIPRWELVIPLLPTQLFGREHRPVSLHDLIGVCLPTGHCLHRPSCSVEPPLHLGVVGVGIPTGSLGQCALGHEADGSTEEIDGLIAPTVRPRAPDRQLAHRVDAKRPAPSGGSWRQSAGRVASEDP